MFSLCYYTSNKVTRWPNWSFQAWVTFYPTRDQQTKCKSCGENGLNGDLLITYDVERQNPQGEVMVHFSITCFTRVKYIWQRILKDWQCKKTWMIFRMFFCFLSGIKWLFCPLLCTLWCSTYSQKCGVYHWPERFYVRQKNRSGKCQRFSQITQKDITSNEVFFYVNTLEWHFWRILQHCAILC